jgi:hypothetical protein
VFGAADLTVKLSNADVATVVLGNDATLDALVTQLQAAGMDHLQIDSSQALSLAVGADPNLSHRADRILSQGWKPTSRGSAVDKCRC